MVLVVLNVFWFCGWVAARRRELGAGSTRGHVMTAQHVGITAGLVVLVFACVVGSMATDKDMGEELSSVSAARSIISGQAAAYDAQVKDRLATIEASTADELCVPFYTNVPHVLLMGDIRDNMDNYINYRLCQWYGKKSIVAYHAPSGTMASGVVTDAPAPDTPATDVAVS